MVLKKKIRNLKVTVRATVFALYFATNDFSENMICARSAASLVVNISKFSAYRYSCAQCSYNYKAVAHWCIKAFISSLSTQNEKSSFFSIDFKYKTFLCCYYGALSMNAFFFLFFYNATVVHFIPLLAIGLLFPLTHRFPP